MKGKCIVVALVPALLSLGTSAFGDVILFTTQDDFLGWSTNASPSMMVAPQTPTSLDASTTNGLGNTSSPGGPGATGSLSVAWVSGTYNFFYSQGEQGNAGFLSALGTANNGGAGYTAASGLISFDYTTPPAGTGNYYGFGLVLNYNNNFGQFFGTAVDNGNGTSTGTIPYTINATNVSNYFQLGLIYNSNYNTNTPFTIDNIRVIPEPAASFGLFCLGGVTALRRRTR